MKIRTLESTAPASGRFYAMVTHRGVGRYVVEGDNRDDVQIALVVALAAGHVNPSKIRERNHR